MEEKNIEEGMKKKEEEAIHKVEEQRKYEEAVCKSTKQKKHKYPIRLQ